MVNQWVLTLILCLFLAWILLSYFLSIPSHITNILTMVNTDPRLGLTIRVNTFRRMDLIEGFLGYYTSTKRRKECAFIKEITVVWSDTENAPPPELRAKYEGSGDSVGGGGDRSGGAADSASSKRVVFEVHTKNSLSNRFLPQQQPSTEAVLSIDDDLVIPCDILARNIVSWSSFSDSLVGYSPRMHAVDASTGIMRYLRWQHTWWSGVYSIVLTKASFLHRDHLVAFAKTVPPAFLDHIDRVRNCEDLAMALTVLSTTRAAPVWIDGIVYEVSGQNIGGISSGGSHFDKRSECLQTLRELSYTTNAATTGGSGMGAETDSGMNVNAPLPWVAGYQKVLSMSLLDTL